MQTEEMTLNDEAKKVEESNTADLDTDNFRASFMGLLEFV